MNVCGKNKSLTKIELVKKKLTLVKLLSELLLKTRQRPKRKAQRLWTSTSCSSCSLEAT